MIEAYLRANNMFVDYNEVKVCLVFIACQFPKVVVPCW